MSAVQKVKLLLKFKIYLVPNLESTIVRVLVTNVTHLYETEIEGDLTIEKDLVAYIAYVEENGQLVPRALRLLSEYTYSQWYSMTVLTMLALTLFFLMAVLIVLLVALHPKD